MLFFFLFWNQHFLIFICKLELVLYKAELACIRHSIFIERILDVSYIRLYGIHYVWNAVSEFSPLKGGELSFLTDQNYVSHHFLLTQALMRHRITFLILILLPTPFCGFNVYFLFPLHGFEYLSKAPVELR